MGDLEWIVSGFRYSDRIQEGSHDSDPYRHRDDGKKIIRLQLPGAYPFPTAQNNLHKY